MSFEFNVQRRHWCGTIHLRHLGCESEVEMVNHQEKLHEVLSSCPGLRYASYQLEKGGNTERMHYQIYVEFTSSLRVNQVYKRLPAHWEPRNGEREVARSYTMKQDSRIAGPWEFGEWREETAAKKQPSPSKQALGLLMKGHEPATILYAHPEIYFHMGPKIEFFFANKERYGITWKTISDEEE